MIYPLRIAFKGFVLPLALVVLASVNAPAAEMEPASCQTQANTVEMIQCADWHLNFADRWLNQVYKATMASLDDPARKLLRDAQRAWAKFRDAECLSERDAARGGTMASILEIDCRSSMAQDRAQYLSSGSGLALEKGIQFFEKPNSSVLGAFKCTDQIMQARVGLSAMSSPDDSFVQARVTVGSDAMEWAIDEKRQNAFCGADLSLSVVPDPVNAACPALRIDDGQCDALVVRWNAETGAFEWLRN